MDSQEREAVVNAVSAWLAAANQIVDCVGVQNIVNLKEVCDVASEEKFSELARDLNSLSNPEKQAADIDRLGLLANAFDLLLQSQKCFARIKSLEVIENGSR